MERIKKLSMAGTIICLISLIIYIIFAILISFKSIDLFLGFANDSMGKMGQVDSNSPSAGFEILAYLAGGALGFLGGLFSVLFAIFLGFLAIYQIPAIVSGFIANSRYKKGYDIQECLKLYKIDGFIKAIMNGIVLAITISGTIFEFVKMPGLDDLILIVLVWNFIAVFVLSIFQIRDVEGYYEQI